MLDLGFLDGSDDVLGDCNSLSGDCVICRRRRWEMYVDRRFLRISGKRRLRQGAITRATRARPGLD